MEKPARVPDEKKSQGVIARQILQLPLMLHVSVVLLLLWIASVFRVLSTWMFVVAFVFLFEADRHYIHKVHRRLRSEGRRAAYQRRPLSDSESVWWLNVAIESIWPIFLQKFSQGLLLSVIPWFLDKYKPWTARKAILRHLNLGKNPPIFTEIRALDHLADDDHLGMELGMDFSAAEDMSAVLAVQMRRRLGLGIWTTINISKLQLEGKVRMGVKFSDDWPFLDRVRICFESTPDVQMTIRPIFHHGVDVSEIPGIAGWMDKMMADALEQSLVEPNMIVVDVRRLVATLMDTRPSPSMVLTDGPWFHLHQNAPTAYVQLEILEAVNLKPADRNGLADPFVKVLVASYQFKTKIQKKTLEPKWQEEFRIPIASWNVPNNVIIHVRDKDYIIDDSLGHCRFPLAKFRGGQRHDIWLPLEGVKTGKLHLAITVLENTPVDLDKEGNNSNDNDTECATFSQGLIDLDGEPSCESADVDEFEAINLEHGRTGIVSIMRPGRQIKGGRHKRTGKPDATIQKDSVDVMLDSPLTNTQLDELDIDSSSEDENGISMTQPRRRHWGWHFPGRSPKATDMPAQDKNVTSSPQGPVNTDDILMGGEKGTAIRMKLGTAQLHLGQEDINNLFMPTVQQEIPTPHSASTPSKGKRRDMAKDFLKQAGKKAHDMGHGISRKSSDRGGSSETGRDCFSREGSQLFDDQSHSIDRENVILPGCESQTDQQFAAADSPT
eukprot:c26229_g1_i1 orf=519-2684(-)